MTFEFKTEPFDHQREEWDEHKETKVRALFWEMGTGKSWSVINTAAWLAYNDKIDALFVVAPNGVHRNWITDELPAHMPDCIDWTGLVYEAPKAGTKWHQQACKDLLGAKFPVLAMTYDAFITKAGKKFAWKFLDKRRCFYTLDESRRIKTPGTKRGKSVVASGKYAEYKRVCCGTPVANGPFDVYNQIRFLTYDYWKQHGLGSFTGFKTFFGIWEQFQRNDTGQRFQTLVAYRALDQLYALLAPIMTRVLKDDVLDLPPKLYSTRYFEISPEQARIYDSLMEEYMAVLESGETVFSPLAITRELRLCQILSGYLPTEESDELRMLGDRNPRLELLKEVVADVPHQGIIWARFRKDIDLICEMIGHDNCVRYDGKVKSEDRAENKRKFKAGEVQWFVGNPKAGGTGLTLCEAKTVIYYNNDYDPEARQQSEDRAHRIGTDSPVNYIDLCCAGTIDVKIAKSHQMKLVISAETLGDGRRKKVSEYGLPSAPVKT